MIKLKKLSEIIGKFRGVAHSECNLRYKAPKEIPVVSHNGSTNDYYFIIKQLAEKFEGEFECLRENTEKYITFSVPIRKGNDNSNIITYKLTFIDSYRFIQLHYQILLINYQEFMIKNAKNAWKEKKLGLTLPDLKVVD